MPERVSQRRRMPSRDWLSADVQRANVNVQRGVYGGFVLRARADLFGRNVCAGMLRRHAVLGRSALHGEPRGVRWVCVERGLRRGVLLRGERVRFGL